MRGHAGRVRQLARTPHHFTPSARVYGNGEVLCRYCNQPETADHHAAGAIALHRITRKDTSP